MNCSRLLHAMTDMFLGPRRRAFPVSGGRRSWDTIELKGPCVGSVSLYQREVQRNITKSEANSHPIHLSKRANQKNESLRLLLPSSGS
jgi:hypothetical protein